MNPEKQLRAREDKRGIFKTGVRLFKCNHGQRGENTTYFSYRYELYTSIAVQMTSLQFSVHTRKIVREAVTKSRLPPVADLEKRISRMMQMASDSGTEIGHLR